MTQREASGLTRREQRVVAVLVAVWVLSKVYRMRLLEEYGLFSWELWRADLAIAGALVLVGVVAFRVARRHDRSAGEQDR